MTRGDINITRAIKRESLVGEPRQRHEHFRGFNPHHRMPRLAVITPTGKLIPFAMGHRYDHKW
jgi:hypothetical protein